jgi:shikimate kinase
VRNASKGPHILFIGFMGSGKSTVARRLARRYHRPLLDVDAGIAAQAGMTIPQIFAAEGEKGFRTREYAYLQTLAVEPSSIVSCGGGVIVDERSRALLPDLGTVIYLHVEAAEAVGRISHPETRPLLNGERSPAALLEERLPFYREAADIMYDTSGKNPGIVANELGRMLEEKGLLWQ